MELFEDAKFSNGFQVFGPTHESGIIGTITPNGGTPKWRVAQWACKSNFLKGHVTALEKNGYCISTSTQKVSIAPGNETDGDVIIELKATNEYNGHVRALGEEWPHLLIEQADIGNRCPKFDQLKSLRIAFETKLVYFNANETNPDPKLHAGMVNMFFTVQDNDDYFWFGVPIFDNRYKGLYPGFKAEDGGKDDATHKYIYNPEQKLFVNRTLWDKSFVKYDTDILPLIKQGVEEAKSKGYLKKADLSRMVITTMNLGWEMTGSYDGALAFKNLSLTAEI